MAAALEGGQHGKGVRFVLGLSKAAVIQEHHGVRGDDDLIVGAEGGGRVGLFPGDVAYHLLGTQALGEILLRVGHPHVKVLDAHAREQLLPPGRPGGQYQFCHM